MSDDRTTQPDMVTTAQRRYMHVLFKEAGIVDRDSRLRVTSEMLGRVIESSSTLSRRDAAALIDTLLTGDFTEANDDKIAYDPAEDLF